MKRLFVLGILAIILFGNGKAQQMPLYSQYMLNGFILNPAAAGAEGYSAINVTAREQWVGFPNGPATFAASFQTRVMKKSFKSKKLSVHKKVRLAGTNSNVGVGAYLFNHRNGAVSRTGFKGTYAYHIRLPHSQLSFGLSLVALQYRLDDEKITFKHEGDELWAGAHQSVFIPDADFGVFYSSPALWLGFSAEQLFESVLKFGDSGYDRFILQRHFYLMGGYDFKLNRTLIFTPSALVKYAEEGRFQADLTGKFYFEQLFWAGLTYRTGKSIIMLTGVSVDRLVFGYAFGVGIQTIDNRSFGTHEFTFIAKIGNQARRHRWLNRF
jgi:type IX secretion system PorP/SprF family membrane protein